MEYQQCPSGQDLHPCFPAFMSIVTCLHTIIRMTSSLGSFQITEIEEEREQSEAFTKTLGARRKSGVSHV